MYTLLYALLLMVFFTLLRPSASMSVYADGGALNLAYVSGTTGGISVIDVGQGKVTKSIAVTGDPHTILLSQDGRYLYVTQPAIDQVAVIAARTGKVVCSAHLPGVPTLLAFDLNTNILFAAGNGATDVSAINPTNCDERSLHSTPATSCS